MKTSKTVALGGIISSLSLACLALSSIFPFAEYSSPALAGILLVVLVIDINKKTAFVAYGAISILAVFIMPNKEAVIIFVGFLGYYPILKSFFEQFKSRVVEYLLKFLLFNIMIFMSYFVIINLFGITEILDDMGGFSQYGIYGLLALGNIAFLVYDFALTRLILTYIQKIKPKLRIKK